MRPVFKKGGEKKKKGEEEEKEVEVGKEEKNEGKVIWLLDHSPTLQCHSEDVHVQPDECPRDLDGWILFFTELHPFYPSLSYACSVSSVSFSVPTSFLTQVP